MALEGKEFEKNFSDLASVSVDVTDEGYVEANAKVRVDLVAELRKLAAKTDNEVDDGMVDMIERALRGKKKEA